MNRNSSGINVSYITVIQMFVDFCHAPLENQDKSGKRGKKVGIAYELENGDIIYVPE